jgi:hypothetical protein
MKVMTALFASSEGRAAIWGGLAALLGTVLLNLVAQSIYDSLRGAAWKLLDDAIEISSQVARPEVRARWQALRNKQSPHPVALLGQALHARFQAGRLQRTEQRRTPESSGRTAPVPSPATKPSQSPIASEHSNVDPRPHVRPPAQPSGFAWFGALALAAYVGFVALNPFGSDSGAIRIGWDAIRNTTALYGHRDTVLLIGLALLAATVLLAGFTRGFQYQKPSTPTQGKITKLAFRMVGVIGIFATVPFLVLITATVPNGLMIMTDGLVMAMKAVLLFAAALITLSVIVYAAVAAWKATPPPAPPKDQQPLGMQPLIPKMELPKLEFPKMELPKVEPPKFELPKMELPEMELHRIDPLGVERLVNQRVVRERPAWQRPTPPIS